MALAPPCVGLGALKSALLLHKFVSICWLDLRLSPGHSLVARGVSSTYMTVCEPGRRPIGQSAEVSRSSTHRSQAAGASARRQENRELNEIIDGQTREVAFARAVRASTETVYASQADKLLGVKPRALSRYLREIGWVCHFKRKTPPVSPRAFGCGI